MRGTARGRRALATVAAFGTLVVAVFFVAQIMVLRGFESVDRDAGREDGLRLRFALRAQVLQLEDIGFSWADWTAAYEYLNAKTVQQRLAFERDELADESLVPLDCDMFAYLSTSGEKVFAVSIDHQNKRTDAAPSSWLSALRESGMIAKVPLRTVQNSIISVNGEPILVSLQQVHRSGRPKEWNGAIVVGRRVGAQVKKALQEQLRLPVDVGTPKDTPSFLLSPSSSRRRVRGTHAEGRAADLLDAGSRNSISLVEGEDTIEVKTLFADPRGRAVLWATTYMPRVAKQQGVSSLRSFFIALVGLGTVSGIIAFCLREALARADIDRQQERENFNLLTRHLPDRLFIRDLNDQQTRAYGDAPGGPARDWLAEALPEAQRTKRDNWLALLAASGERAEHEWDLGEETWLELVTPVRVKGEKAPVSHLIGAAIDISGRKRAEREKDVLLKEIHHRVKNNLQIVVSLLNLQANTIDDPLARDGFEDARARVRSMALIHEQLYRQSDLSHVDFGAYLESLLQLLLRSHRQAPVRLSSQLDPLPLDIDLAVPCGLIVTELVTNAFKYAFAPSGTSGQGNTLSVRLCSDAMKGVLLQIEDDGPGLPDDFCLEESESLGLQIVDSLVTQIDGTIEASRGENERGTCWTLRFAAVESSDKRLQIAA